MSVIAPAPATASPQTTHRKPLATMSLWRATAVIGLAAAAATTAFAAAAHAAGVPLYAHGEIPLPAFAQMTSLGAVVGGVVAAIFKCHIQTPARRFVQVTAALVVISCVPSVTLPSHLATKLALVATHLIAAAIIVPVLTRRLTD